MCDRGADPNTVRIGLANDTNTLTQTYVLSHRLL